QGPTDLYVQFIGEDGRVTGAGTAALGLPPLAGPATSTRPQIVAGQAARVGRLRVLSALVSPNATLTLVLARSAQDVGDVHDTLVRLFFRLVVVGSLLLGALTWWVVGRALRPVDSMRRQVDDLGDHDLAVRLLPPRTGDELDRLGNTLNALLGRLEQAV